MTSCSAMSHPMGTTCARITRRCVIRSVIPHLPGTLILSTAAVSTTTLCLSPHKPHMQERHRRNAEITQCIYLHNLVVSIQCFNMIGHSCIFSAQPIHSDSCATCPLTIVQWMVCRSVSGVAVHFISFSAGGGEGWYLPRTSSLRGNPSSNHALSFRRSTL